MPQQIIGYAQLGMKQPSLEALVRVFAGLAINLGKVMGSASDAASAVKRDSEILHLSFLPFKDEDRASHGVRRVRLNQAAAQLREGFFGLVFGINDRLPCDSEFTSSLSPVLARLDPTFPSHRCELCLAQEFFRLHGGNLETICTSSHFLIAIVIKMITLI